MRFFTALICLSSILAHPTPIFASIVPGELREPLPCADRFEASPLKLHPEAMGEEHGKFFGLFHRVKYLRSEKDRARYLVEAKDGRLYQRKRPLSTSYRSLRGMATGKLRDFLRVKTDPEWKTGPRTIFVLSKDQKLYASNSAANHVFHHSSFVAGDQVLAAGEFYAVNGKLVWINDFSGHYRPGFEHSLKLLVWLQDHGVDLTDVETSLPWLNPPSKYRLAFKLIHLSRRGDDLKALEPLLRDFLTDAQDHAGYVTTNILMGQRIGQLKREGGPELIQLGELAANLYPISTSFAENLIPRLGAEKSTGLPPLDYVHQAWQRQADKLDLFLSGADYPKWAISRVRAELKSANDRPELIELLRNRYVRLYQAIEEFEGRRL